jgi:hypothetical protein
VNYAGISRLKTKGIFMQTIGDSDFDSIISGLAACATWRRQQAKKWPGDPRNGRAAEALDELAQSTTDQVSAATWAAVEPYLGKLMAVDVLSEACRECGFKARYKNIEAFLMVVGDKIAARRGGVA